VCRQVLTAWNFRRDTLGALLPGADAERAAALLGTRPAARPHALTSALHPRICAAYLHTVLTLLAPSRAALLFPSVCAAEELQLCERALRRNPKSYGAWHHRKWTLRALGPARADLGRELALCAQLLAADERNFHCWGFRRRAAVRGIARAWMLTQPCAATLFRAS
jgi:geranylgeranyl transferase type-2 subunit alpha